MSPTHRYDEAKHPRGSSGRFAVKQSAEAADVTLETATTPAPNLAMGPVETSEALWCEACEEAFTVDDAERLYECGTCGAVSTERRCEQCHKFMARSEEPGCPHCQEPVEATPVLVVVDHDGRTVRVEDYDADGPAKKVRDAAEKAKADERAASEAAARLAAKRANAAEGTAATVEPGVVLIDPDDTSRWASRDAEVLSVRHVETPEGPIVVMKTYSHGLRTVVRRADAKVPVAATVAEYPTEDRGPNGRRLNADDFGGARFNETFDPKMSAVSAPSNGIEVIVGSASRSGGTLPVVALMLGQRNHTGSIGGMVTYLGVFDDPEKAESALGEFERAADALAAARAEHPPAASDDEDEAWDVAHRVAGWDSVSTRRNEFVHTEAAASLDLQIGLSSWHRDKGALLHLSNSAQNAAMTDPDTLRRAVAEARRHLPTLTGIPTRPDVVDDKI
ncbi:hypothetical protein ASF47_18135 [Nocardioides sp. Leaf285]|nr:hypothetical protein ASF47_18135 [Nocardioides sp. Leaf285]